MKTARAHACAIATCMLLISGSIACKKGSGSTDNNTSPEKKTNAAIVDPVTITHGMQLTTSIVGPAGISISTFTTVPGGTFTGTALSSWGSLARTVAKGGEVIDGFTFPEGTVVLQGANITANITVSSGWLVLRGCKGGILLNHPTNNGGGGAALYCELTNFNTVGYKDKCQPAAGIVHRCYFPHSGLENVYSDNITVTENWITPDPAAPNSGEHIDAIQTWGGQRNLNFSRNYLEFNPPYTQSGGLSGLIAMYSDGDNNRYEGYDHITIKDNYFVLHGYGIGLHAPLGVPVNNIVVTGNRWKWSTDADDEDYTNAVYRNASLSMPKYKDTVNGNKWADNRWADGPHKNKFLLPDNRTSATEY